MQNLKISLLCVSLLVMFCIGLVLFRPVLPSFHQGAAASQILADTRSTTPDQSKAADEDVAILIQESPDQEEPIADWAADDDWADRIDDRIHTVRSLADSNTTLGEGRVVLFIDATWSLPVVAWRQPFLEFSTWCHERSVCIPVRIQLSDPDEEWQTIESFREANAIPSYGYAFHNGAGQVIWLENGRVLEHSNCINFPDAAAVIAWTKTVFR